MVDVIQISVIGNDSPVREVVASPENAIKPIDTKIMGLFPIRSVPVSGCFGRNVQNLQVPERSTMVINQLKEEFGEGIINRILTRYGLNGKEFLSLEDYKAIRIGIAANVNIQDLTDVYKSKLCINPNEEPNLLNDKSDEEINELLEKFRNDLPIDAWQKDLEGNSDLPYSQLVLKDLSVLRTCYEVKFYGFQKDHNIAFAEHLAHDVAYVDLEVGQIIPVKDKDDKIKFTKVSSVINDNGMVCSILTPLIESQNLEDFKVNVLFRGTHDMKSFRRLYEPFSAGHLSFKHHHKNLMDQISGLVPLKARQVSIASFGHSLGGADAQRFTSLVACSIARIKSTEEELAALRDENGINNYERPYTFVASPDWEKIRPTVSKIKNVAMCVYNSAGIANTTNDLFKNAVRSINTAKLEGEQKLGDAKPIANCNFRVTHCKVGGDFVQQVGETSLGHNLEFDQDIVAREVYQFQHGYEGIRGFFSFLGLSSLYAHTIKNLHGRVNKGIEPKFDYWNAKEDLDAVNKATGYHQTWLNVLWQKIKWYVMSFFFGSSLLYKRPGEENGTYYRPWNIPEGALV